MRQKITLLALGLVSILLVFGQSGPAGVGNASINEVWLKASDISLAVGSNVQEWTDASGNGYGMIQNTASNQPVLQEQDGIRVLRFDPSGGTSGHDFMSNSSSYTARTVIIVFRVDLNTHDGANDLGQLWGDYQRGVHIAVDARNAVQEFSFDGNNASTRARYGMNGASYGGYTNETGVNDWVNEKFELVVAEFQTDKVLNEHYIGDLVSPTGHYLGADIAEIIVFSTQLNAAQKIVIENYLAAKFGLTLSQNDFYAYQDGYGNEVAGLGQISSASQTESWSGTVLGISGLTSLDDNDFLIFGHDGGAVNSWTTVNTPFAGSNIKRINRTWRLDETVSAGDVGNITLTIDTTLFAARDAGYSKFVVLLDNDGDFSDATRIKELTSAGGNNFFSISNLEINDGDFLTIAEIKPVVQFATTESRGFEDGNAIISISSNVELASDITVQVTTSNGGGIVDDAIAGSDYTALLLFDVTIAAGSLSENVIVTVADDGDLENDESFTLTLTSSDVNVSLGDNTTHVYTINDNEETETVYFSLSTSSVAEAVTTHNVEVTSSGIGSVDYRVVGGTATSGSDYTSFTGTLNFAGAGTQNVGIDILNDAIPESNETIIVELYNPVGLRLDGTNFLEHSVTIDDSGESLYEVKFTEPSDENYESVTSYNISLGLTGVAEVDVEVTYVVSGNGVYGEDHTLANGTFTIPAGVTNYNLELPIIDDNIEEQQDTIVVTLTNAVNANLGTITRFQYFVFNDDFGFTGPGGVGSSVAIKQWFRADKNVTATAGKVSVWGDYSGNGFDLTQVVAGEQPTLINNMVNGFPAVAFDGGASGTSGHEWLSWTATGTGYQAQEVFAVYRVSTDSMSTTSLGQLWGSYHDSMHVAVEARNLANKQGFSFDGVPDPSLTARYSLDGQYFQGQTAGVPSYYTWNYDQWHMVVADFPNVNTLEENKMGRLVTSGPTNYWYGGYIAEVAVYSSTVDSADRIIIENYLAAKYGITLANNDMYAYENIFKYDVAGIGKTSDNSYHFAAQSSKIFKISEASDLENGEFMLFGHNNADTSFSTTDAPSSYQRLARVWRFDQTGGDGVGKLTVDIDASEIGELPASATSVVLLVDNDGVFNNGVTSEYTLTLKSGSYQVKNVTIPDGAYLTVACKEPTLTFENNIQTGSEGVASQSITVRLSNVSSETITVEYSITGSDATNPDDYTISSTSPLTFNPGEVSKTIDLSIVDDTDSESAEYITFQLANPTNASFGLYNELSYYILDNDGLEYQGPAGIGNLTSQVNVWFNNVNQTNLTDGDKIDNGTKKWLNQTENSGIDAFQDIAANQPTFYTTTVSWNKKPIVYFQPGKNTFLKVPDNSYMNTFSNATPQTQRSVWVVFQPGADVVSRQVVFEEGGGTRGLNVYIENNNIYLGMWNDNDQGGTVTPMPYQSSSAAILGNKPYFALLEFDYKAPDDSEIRGTVNGTQLNDYNGAGAALYSHGGDIGIGAMNGGSCFSGDDCDGGNGHYFAGYIAEFASAKEIYNTAQKYILFNYFAAKYGIPITTPDLYDYDINYGYELFGIGQVDVNNSHYAAKGTGIIKLENPLGIGDGEFLLVGHDTNVVDSWVQTSIPNSDSTIYRVERVWRVDETGDVGSLTFRLDTTQLDTRPSQTLNYCLIVDSDGDFTSGSTIKLLNSTDTEAGTVYTTGIDFNAGDYFTIGCITPSVDFTVSSGETPEGNTTVKVAVALNVALTADVTVDYTFANITPTISNPNDYIGTSGTLTITAGNLSDSITFEIKQDDLGEINEQFSITLSNPTGGVIIGFDNTYIHSIIDEDLTQKVNFGQQVRSGAENIASGNDTVYVVLVVPASGGGISVDVQILGTSTADNDSVDYYLLNTQTLNFADGVDSIAIVFDIIDDNIDELNETIVLRLTNPQGQVNLGDTTQFTYTIIDNDDTPEVDFTVGSASGAESITPVQVEVVLSAPSGQDVVVDFVVDSNVADSAILNEDYRFDITSVTIPAGETTAYYLLDIINDPGYEASNEIVKLDIDNVTNANIGSTNVSYAYTIIDDDFGGWEGPGGVGDLDYQIGCWLRSTQVYNITNGSEIGVQGSVTMWEDQSNNGNDAYKKATNEAPIFYDDDATWNKRPILKFKSFDSEILEIADNDEMNLPTGAQTQRTLIVVFRPGDDVTTRQVLFEEGGGTRGLNIYIHNDSLLIGGYNLSANDEPAWGDTYWSYVPVKFKLEPNTPYFAILQFDFDGTSGDVRGALNGSDFIELPGAKKLYRHGDNIGIGGVNGGARGEDNVSLNSSSNYYNGYFAEFVSGNFVYNTAQLQIVQNYLAAKYNINIGSKDIYEFGDNYGWEVIGIGQKAGNNKHNKSQGQGVIMLYNPTAMNSGDFMFVGHDAGLVDNPSASTGIEEWLDYRFLDVPNNDENIVRIRQEWRVNKVNDVGNVNIDVDFRNNGNPGRFDAKDPEYDKYVMLIDDNGDFTENAEVWELKPSTTLNHNGYYMLANHSFNHGDYFTIGIANTTIGFTDTLYECMENAGTVNVEVKLNMLCAAQTTVGYRIASTTPESANAADYSGTTTSGTLTFNAWDNSEFIPVIINDDAIDENDESFYIILENPVNGELAQDTILFIIHDNDTESKINFSRATDAIVENDLNIVYTGLKVERSVSTAGAASVDYVIYGGTATADEDYVLANGTVNFVDGASSADLDIDVLGDLMDEDYETLILRLTNPISCAIDTITQFTLSIEDNDSPPTLMFTNSEGQGAENVSPVNIELNLSASSGKNIVVYYSAIDSNAVNGGIDYNLITPGSITILAGNATGNIAPDIFNDLVSNEDRVFKVQIDSVRNATLGANDLFRYKIVDDDELGYVGPGGIGDERQYVSWLRAEDETEGDGNAVNTFNDKSGNGNDAVKRSGINAPVLRANQVNTYPALQFSGAELLEIKRDAQIDNAGFSEKSIVVVFNATTVATATPEVIYEQGGGNNTSGSGFAIYIHNSRIYFNAYNNSGWGYTEISTPITTGYHYAIMVFDEGAGELNATLDGTLLTPSTVINAGLKVPTTTGNGLGGMYNSMWLDNNHDGSLTNAEKTTGNGYYFNGYIAEYLQYNFALKVPYRVIIENYLASKYNIAINAASDKFDYSYNDAPAVFYGNHVTGIGQVGSESHIVALGTGTAKLEANQGMVGTNYLLIGDNGGDISSWNDVPGALVGTAKFVDRGWRVSKEGTGLSQVVIGIDISDFPAAPADYPTYVIVVDNDTDLGDDENELDVHNLKTPDGSILRDTITISDGAVIRIGVAKNRSRVNGSWHDPNTWLTGTVPSGNTQTAYISAGQRVWITDATVSIGTIVIEPGGQLDINQRTYIARGALENEGTINLGTSTRLYITDLDITNTGTVNCGAGSMVLYAAGATPQEIISGVNYNSIFTYSGNYNITGNIGVTVLYHYNSAVLNAIGSPTISVGYWNKSGTSTFVPAQSTVEFVGTSSSTYSLSSNLYNMGVNMVLNSGKLTLSSDIEVANNLTLTSGLIDLGVRNLTLSNGATVNYPGTTASYVKADGTGKLIRKVSAGNTYEFPIGDADDYSPFTITMNSFTAGANPRIGINTVDAAPSQIVETSEAHITRYWDVQPTDITNPDYNVSYSYSTDVSDVVGTEGLILPFKWNATNGLEIGRDGSVNTATNTLVWNNITSFSTFGGGSFEALPVEMIYFTALQTDNMVELKWATATEINNDYFEVQRSVDGINFETINIVQGNGNSSATIKYSFKDVDPVSGISYYRLKQVDYDGMFEYSQTISVNYSNVDAIGNISVNVYPIPVSDKLYVNTGGDKLIKKVMLLTPSGLLLSEYSSLGTDVQVVDMTDLAQGIYIIKVMGDNINYSKMVVKE